MKIKLFAVLMLLCLCLSSCSFVSGYSEPEDRYIVSAIGFDKEGDTLEVSVQIVGKEGNLLRSGKGERVRGAMAHIEGADAKQLEISHCAIIIIGDGIDSESLSEIFGYCRENNDITVGVKVAAAHRAKDILSLDADGYELLGAVRDGADGVGFAGGSRFYEIEDTRAVYHLPYFETDGETYTVSGLKIFKKDAGIVKLDRSESAYYMMIKGELFGGSADIEYGEKKDSVFLGKCKTEYKTEGDKLYVSCDIKVNGELLPADREKTEKAMSMEASRLVSELYSRYGDLFGFGDDKEIFVECKLKEDKR